MDKLCINYVLISLKKETKDKKEEVTCHLEKIPEETALHRSSLKMGLREARETVSAHKPLSVECVTHKNQLKFIQGCEKTLKFQWKMGQSYNSRREYKKLMNLISVQTHVSPKLCGTAFPYSRKLPPEPSSSMVCGLREVWCWTLLEHISQR